MKTRTTTPSQEFVTDLKLKGFKVIKIEPTAKGYIEYTRRDFYKMALVKGKVKVHQANEHFLFEGAYLRFSNPHLPYSSEVLSKSYEGYACFFIEEFLNPGRHSKSLQQSPIFRIGAAPAVELNERQWDSMADIFERLLSEQDQNHDFKVDIIRTYITLLIQEALKMDSFQADKPYQKAPLRITARFLELIEQQYPIVSPDQPVQLRTATDFARHLSVHVNYLNRMVKDTTGKTSTEHIAERLVSEAKALLKHTDWNVSEIAHALGFEYPNYFNAFFKKRTGAIPKSFRQ